MVSKASNLWGCWDKWVCHRNINPNAALDKYVPTKLTNCPKTPNNLFLSSAVVGQEYETRVGDIFVMLQNDALVACSFPNFAADLLTVQNWVTSEGENIERSSEIHGISNSCRIRSNLKALPLKDLSFQDLINLFCTFSFHAYFLCSY